MKKGFAGKTLFSLQVFPCKGLQCSSSCLEAHAGLFTLSMKGIFDAYVVLHFGKKLIFELQTRVNTCDFTVCFIYVWVFYNSFFQIKIFLAQNRLNIQNQLCVAILETPPCATSIK